MKNNVSKLFAVMVLGGALQVNAQDLDQSDQTDVSEPDEICQISMQLKHYDFHNERTEKTCLDGKTDVEVIQKLKEYQGQTCITPFCGCWLG